MTSHSGKTLDEPTIAEFKSSLRGALIRPGDNGYDAARKIHNAMIDRRPGFIVRCAGVADVIAAVNFARSHNLLVAIRGTGHNVAGTSLCDGGLVIDLSLMKSVRIDPLGRRARVEGGASWGELNHDLQAFGLAATGGFISTTGVSGLTLGGGLGWLVRKHSLALDNLVSADVVTADGQLLIASASQNEDLFWGLRGGGGNFGVVTSFEFQVHPAGTVLAGLVFTRPRPARRPCSSGASLDRQPRKSSQTALSCLMRRRICQSRTRCARNRSSVSAASIRVRSTRRNPRWRRSGGSARRPLT
jgi:UDP-N-acetylenolpyruvoylglucosamine reductase